MAPPFFNPTAVGINEKFFSTLGGSIKCNLDLLHISATIKKNNQLSLWQNGYNYTVSALSEAYQMSSESSRLSFQIFSQSPATKLKVLYNQKSSEQYQLPNELANKNHCRSPLGAAK